MQGVIYIQIVLFKLLDSLMFQGPCFGKFVMESFVNYLVNKRILTLKKQVASPERQSTPLITLQWFLSSC